MLDMNDLRKFIDAQYEDRALKVLIRFISSGHTMVPRAFDVPTQRRLVSKGYNHVLIPQVESSGEARLRPALYYFPSQPKRGLSSLVPLSPRLVVPQSFRERLMQLFHDAQFGGHLGERRTHWKMSVNYY